MDEAQTRQRIIDKRLALAGWTVDDPTQVTSEFDIDLTGGTSQVAEPTGPYSGHQFVDYALLGHGKPIAVVEAKRTSKDAQLGKEQALQYAQNLQTVHGIPLPLVLYTNGHEIHLWDYGTYAPQKVHGFPTRDDLDWMAQQRELRQPLSEERINTDIAGRGYQIQAIRAVLERVTAKRCKLLLVMATGTGKTRVAVALADVLRRAKWAKRVLFLVDRIALRDQALETFKEHIPAEPRWPKRRGNGIEKAFAKDRRIYVSTYPTMLNLIQAGTTPATYISPCFFDLVIADESHRSIYNVYRQVLDYFRAITVGLTATPRDHIDHDTFKLFECDSGDPTFAYTYEEAVEHEPPYLSRYEVLKVRSKFQLEGIQGGTLPLAVQKKLLAEGLDPEEIDFEGTDLERKVSNAGTNALIVREFMEESIKGPSGTLPGKSIIFAISKAHARGLQGLFDTLYPEHKGRLARVLVSEDSRVHGKGGLLDQFKTRDMPRVAISVDMLDTGVDVPEVVNLVFAKPVYSYTKFWQMIGRGTRVLDANPAKRKVWCPEKGKFLIIDCWGNFDFFKMKPDGRETGQQIPLPVRLFRSRLDEFEAALAVADVAATATVRTNLREDLASLPENNVIVSESRVALERVFADVFWTSISADDLGHLRTVIAPVLRARSGVDVKALRFELDISGAATALLAGNSDAVQAIGAVLIEQIADLPLTVNVVAKERDLIEAVQTPAWWQDVTHEQLHDLAERLAPLMRYRQSRTVGMVHLDIEDLLAIKETVEFGPDKSRLGAAAYREKVEAFVRALVAENEALQKLRRGEDLSPTEVTSLAEQLATHDPYVTEDLLRRVYDHRTARFLRFIRHILDLEPLGSWTEEVTAAFDDFITRHDTYSSAQISFLKALRTFVIQRGEVRKRDLVSAPFTRLHPQGIRGLFAESDIDEILSLAGGLVA